MSNEKKDTISIELNLKDAGEAAKNVSGKLTFNRSSVASLAKQNLFEFRAFVSSSCSLEHTTAAVQLVEQINASYLQMAISANPITTLANANSGNQFSNFKTDTKNYVECATTDYMVECCHNEIKNDEGVMVEFDMISVPDSEARVINEYFNHQPLSEFDHYFSEAYKPSDFESSETTTENQRKYDEDGYLTGTNGSTKTSKHRMSPAEEAKLKAELEDKQLSDENGNRYSHRKIKADTKKSESEERSAAVKATNDETYGERKAEADTKKSESEERSAAVKADNDEEYGERKAKADAEGAEEKAKETKWKNSTEYKNTVLGKNKTEAPKLMDESKIQKLNSMKPLMMTVNMQVVNKDETITPMEYAVGVKMFTTLIDASMLPEIAAYPLKEMNRISRFAKWRAGELKLFKDIIFKIPQKKQTAVDSKDPNRKWYRRLYELAHSGSDAATTSTLVGKGGKNPLFIMLAGLKNKISSGKGFMPDATMIITKDDVDNINRETGIDLLSDSKAYNFCRELFLLSFVVIDLDAQSIKIMTPDLHKKFEIHSLASVNKQISLLDSSSVKTNEIFKMLK